jgi:CheY-like chemotaxis protein
MGFKVVLVADDKAEIRMMMRTLLEYHGFRVIEAANGVEAYEKAVAKHPDIILMDLAMPLMQGLEATRLIRNHEETSSIPIIALTAFGEAYRSQAIEAGCNEVLQKPLDLSLLPPLINELAA